MRRYVPLLIVLALVASACKIRFDTSISINSDESGTFAIEVSADEEFRQLGEEDGGGFDLTDGIEDVPGGWNAEPFVDGEFEGVRISTDFSNLEDLNSRIQELSEAGGDTTATSDMFGVLSITRNGDNFEFRTEGLVLGDDLTGGADAGFEGLDPTAFFESLFEIRLKVTLPGTPGDNNADQVDGNTFIWSIGLDDEGREFFASTTGSGGSGLNPAALAIIALVLAVGVWLVLARRQKAEPATLSSNDDEEASDAADGDPFDS